MGRRLRFIPSGGALVEITCRTIQGRFLLKPTDELREIIIGTLGRAQRLYPVDIHAFVFMSNHYHLLLSVPDARRLVHFLGYANSKLARETGRPTGWRDKVWSRRYQAVVVSEEEFAQVGRLRYVLAHGVKEGLVDHPADWPGANTVTALLEGRALQGLWFDRSKEWAARQRRERYHHLRFATKQTLELEPLPCWAHYSAERLRSTVSALIAGILADYPPKPEKSRDYENSLAALLDHHPHERPEKLKRSPAPWFHCATKAARKDLIEAYGWFLAAYQKAAEKLRAGNLNVGFPEGSHPPPLPFVGGTPSFAPT
jgi:REP element-mobilizing transposase RayT